MTKSLLCDFDGLTLIKSTFWSHLEQNNKLEKEQMINIIQDL